MIDEPMKSQKIKPRAPYAAPTLVLLDVESDTKFNPGPGADGDPGQAASHS